MKQSAFLALMLACVSLSGCGGSSAPAQPILGISGASPTPTATGSSAPTHGPTASPVPSASPTPAPSPTVTATPSTACAAPATGNLYVADFGNNLVTIYPSASNGNVAPTRTISGLFEPQAVAFDSSGNLYVYSGGATPAITEYAAGTSTVVATISGSLTGLKSGYGIALDSFKEIFVTNTGAGQVEVFDSGSNGNTGPIRTFTTPGGSPAWSIALDSSGNEYVASGASIYVFAAGASGAATPIRTISGAATDIAAAIFINLDASGNIYTSNVVSSSSSSVLAFTNGANGNVAPFRDISGALTGLNPAQGLAFDTSANLYAASGLQNAIDVYAPATNGNVAPCRLLQGSNTMLSAPEGIAIGP